MNPKYYIISGEASGDLHGSNLIFELRKNHPNCQIRFWGGDLMSNASNETPVMHFKELAYMGLIEVLKHLPEIFRNLKFCKKDILEFQPDALILIDYPGFNLRIAKWAHQNNINVQYYISPKIWAWNTSRVHKIKSYINNMYVILPFEKDFYARYNFKVTYVGNPLLDEISSFEPRTNFLQDHNLEDKKIIAVLPGSRLQELRKSLPIMVKMASVYTAFQFCIAKVPSIDIDTYNSLVGLHNQSLSNITFIENDTYNLLTHAKLALVTSGTATLEAALFKVPQIVCYKTNPISYYIGRMLIKVKYLSLVNLIMDKPVVVELIQNEFNEIRLKENIDFLLKRSFRNQIIKDYDKLIEKLGSEGAAKIVAKTVYSSID